jgi:hypothetical protein
MRARLGVEIGCGVGAFLLYGATACRTVFVGDGGELIAAADGWGVAHPPGYPLWTLLAKLALLLPLGEPAFRTNLLSALLGALACALAAHLARRWTDGSVVAGIVAGIVAAALLATGRTFWSASTVTEVYTAHVLLALAILWAADRVRAAEDRAALRRAVAVLGAFSGLALAHHPTVVLVLPAAAVLAWRVRDKGRKARGGPAAGAGAWLAAAGLAIAIPALAYGSLLLRARAAPEATWNHFTTGREWWAHVTAAAYRPFDLGWGALLDGDRIALVLGSLARDLGPAGVLLAIAGAVAAVPRIRAALLLLLALHAGFALRYGTEDVEVNLLAAVAAAALLAGIGAAPVLAPLPERWRAAAGAALVVVALVPGALRFRAMDLRATTLAADYGRDVLASVPSGGVLVADGDNAFVLQYLVRVLGERPDLAIYDRGGHVLRALTPSVQQRLLQRVRRGEVSLTFLSWPGDEPEPGLRYRPRGLVFALEREDATAGAEPELRGERVAAQAKRSGDLLARTLAATYPLMRGERALFDVEVAGAERAFDEARALAGDSETVRNTLGTIYGRRGELHRAREEFEAALQAKPASPRAAANLETVRRMLGAR